MNLDRARLRYLSAIGVVLPLAACREPTPPTVSMLDADTATTASATTTAPPSAIASASVTPTATGPTAPTIGLHTPSCPSGQFCVSEKAKLDAKETAAPAPYAKCAASAPHPNDAADAAYKPYRAISF